MQKKTLLLTILAILTLGCSVLFFPATTQAATLSRQPNNLGLIGYWPLNEGDGTKASDASGNGNTGTLTNGPTWTSGKLGGAMNFDGSNDYVTIPDSDALSPTVATTEMTLCSWIKPAAFADSIIVAKGNGSSYEYGIALDPNGKLTGILWNNVAGTYTYATSTSIARVGAWTQFCFTEKNGVAMKAYTNGLLENQSTSFTGTPAAAIASPSPLNIGRRDDNVYYFQGSIDDVRLYNRVLSATEISAMYGSGSAKYTQPTKTGLVGYWPMDEGMDTKAGDFSGNGNTGTLTNGPTWISGKVGKAVAFDGTDDYIQVPESSSIEPTTITLSAWVYLRQNSLVNAVIFDKANTSHADPYYDYDLRFVNTDTATPSLLGTFVVGSYDTDSALSSALTNVYDRWSHVAATFDGATINVYLNGALVATQANSGTISYHATNLFIGKFKNLSNGYLLGSLDDARIYNRALSSTEITSMYNSGAHAGNIVQNVSQNNKLTSGLVGLWSFNGPDVSGTTAYDRSGNSNNGTLTNGPKIAIGKVGQALQFDGTNDSVDATVSGLPQVNTDRTYTAWIKLNTLKTLTWNTIFTSGTWATNQGFGLAFGLTDSSKMFVWGISHDIEGTRSFTTGTWYHVAVTYTGSTGALKTYVNGVVDINTTTSAYNTQGTALYIGSFYDGGNFLEGSIDDLRIYNRALTAAEVTQLYNMGNPVGQ